MNKKFKVGQSLSLLTLLTTISVYTVFILINLMNQPFSNLQEMGSQFVSKIPGEFGSIVALLNDYVEYSQSVFVIAIIAVAVISVIVPIFLIVILFKNTKKVAQRSNTGLGRYFYVGLVSLILTYLAYTNLTTTDFIFSMFKMDYLVKLNYFIILASSFYVFVISAMGIIRVVKNDEQMTIANVTSSLFKIIAIFIAVLLGFKIITVFVTYIIFMQVVNLIDFSAWISLPVLLNGYYDQSIVELLPPGIDDLLSVVPALADLSIFDSSLASIGLDKMADTYIFDHVTVFARNLVVNIFRPMIFNNFGFYVVGFIVSISSLFINDIHHEKINNNIKLIIRAILVIILVILFTIFLISSYSIYIQLALWLVLIGTIYSLVRQSDIIKEVKQLYLPDGSNKKE